MKASTRQYAKRQVQWIKNKLLPVVRESGGEVTVVLLDATGEPVLFARSPCLGLHDVRRSLAMERGCEDPCYEATEW